MSHLRRGINSLVHPLKCLHGILNSLKYFFLQNIHLKVPQIAKQGFLCLVFNWIYKFKTSIFLKCGSCWWAQLSPVAPHPGNEALPEERNCCPYYYSTSIKITLQWVYVPFSVCKKNIREIFNISIISCVLEKCSMWKHGEEPSTFDQLSVDHQHVFCKSSLIHRPQFENHCHGMWRTVLPGN